MTSKEFITKAEEEIKMYFPETTNVALVWFGRIFKNIKAYFVDLDKKSFTYEVTLEDKGRHLYINRYCKVNAEDIMLWEVGEE